MRSLFIPKSPNQKLQRFLPYPLINFQGRNLCNFWMAFCDLLGTLNAPASKIASVKGISWTKQQQTNGKKWFEMFLCMNSIYAPTFRQISTKLAMRQLKIQKFQASFQLAQLEFFTTNVSKFLCVRARNVSSILSTFAVLLQNLLVKEPLIQPNLKTGISHADRQVL